jgi:hypothetical protein
MWGSCVCTMVEIHWAVFEICSGNDMTRYNQPSFDIRCPPRRLCITKGTSRACGDHVCVIWLKLVERFSRYAPETTWQVTTFFWPLLPFKKVVHPKTEKAHLWHVGIMYVRTWRTYVTYVTEPNTIAPPSGRELSILPLSIQHRKKGYCMNEIWRFDIIPLTNCKQRPIF